MDDSFPKLTPPNSFIHDLNDYKHLANMGISIDTWAVQFGDD
jgi:hypothetical protein